MAIHLPTYLDPRRRKDLCMLRDVHSDKYLSMSLVKYIMQLSLGGPICKKKNYPKKSLGVI